MEKCEYTIKKRSGDIKVQGYSYSGFGINGDGYSLWKWKATIINGGLSVANAPTRKALVAKLDKIIELVPNFSDLDSNAQVHAIRDSLPKGISLAGFAGWLNPTMDYVRSWDEFIKEYTCHPDD